VDENLK
jgi:multidrug resistance protein, MATE family